MKYKKKRLSLRSRYYRTRSSWWRWQRILFPSPAELKLIEIMGGKVLRFKFVKHWRTKFPLAVVLTLGKVLRNETYKREVRCGKYFVDLGNESFWGIEVDGAAYHRDVVAAFERDSYLYQKGWHMTHIQAVRLWLEPAVVQAEVLRFLYQ